MTYKTDSFGISRPPESVLHRSTEYAEEGFKMLQDMQARHFWYRGRHRFLLRSLNQHLKNPNPSMIDLGGGVGGWLRYLFDHSQTRFERLALGDSSNHALMGAKKILPPSVNLFQVDLMRTYWRDEWDVIFLLDVIEHCPDDVSIMRQMQTSLKPGGLLFVTTPALMHFWSHNDEYAAHQRRYNHLDYQNLARASGLRLLDSRYFMFFLSPLYWITRKALPAPSGPMQKRRAIEREHKTPTALLNETLSIIFSAETPIGHKMQFPWGTSLLGVFAKD